MSPLDLHPVILAAIAVILFANLLATRLVFFDDGATATQRTLKLILVWLIPVVGAGLVISFIASHHSRDELKVALPFPFYLVGYRKGATFKANPNRSVGEEHYTELRD